MYAKVVIFSEEQRTTTPFYLLQYSCTFSQNSLQGYGCTLLIDVKQRNQHDHEFYSLNWHIIQHLALCTRQYHQQVGVYMNDLNGVKTSM